MRASPILAVLCLAALLSACGGGTPAADTAVEPQQEQQAAAPVESDQEQPVAAPTEVEPTDVPSPTEVPTMAPTEDTVPSFENGKHLVGTDIQPGIYRNAEAGDGCYWARLSGVGGEFGDIIANDNSAGPTIVEILATDKAFESTRCGKWRMEVNQITESMTSFGPGTFVVGTDIEPGTYRNSGDGSCYWARLSNFQGGFDALTANENADGQTIVEIAASDAGFTSARCGTWEKIE